jgi:membrane protease YdiL (CAAX protease family)
MILAILILSAFLLGLDFLIDTIFSSTLSEPLSTYIRYFKFVLTVIATFFAYKLYVFIFEKRPAYELSFSSFVPETFAGIVAGGGMITLSVIILIIPGFYKVDSFNSITSLTDGLFLFANGAFFEEVLFRLIIFRLVEEFVGSWISMIISALLFGFAHIFNDNATLWSATAIAIEAGFLLAVAFMLTRRIWFAFGLHFGWNFLQASVFGIATSGNSFEGLISPGITGPSWLTGGAFGIEASLITIIIGLIAALILLKMVIIDSQTVFPVWKRKSKAEIFY